MVYYSSVVERLFEGTVSQCWLFREGCMVNDALTFLHNCVKLCIRFMSSLLHLPFSSHLLPRDSWALEKKRCRSCIRNSVVGPRVVPRVAGHPDMILRLDFLV